MNIESLVPPLELCKLIPAGYFADSALVWSVWNNWGVITEEVQKRNTFATCPAPTLHEILLVLPRPSNYIFQGMRPVEEALRLWMQINDIEVISCKNERSSER